ncbi:hypothetical protein [Limnobacter profundi]|uniref:DUF904 domain-containing protein n=1 Tax=Limnobacter profundi TaxID=2732163 RepID=A0ABX6N4E7_9BURK|nr:hypothetical protein [Limnobacter sp. SAORIC-580]PZO12710.1 MAG: hypothetical protein DCE87_14515 [Betaproteobacteria bacterium]PZO23443.1 MAG: hypothetical protein DCE89_09940 [Betaproteobacteria bacterium]QJR28222.1 hypothetical protein HKT17_00125 [Limnobacter sp. SAORIC-580]
MKYKQLLDQIKELEAQVTLALETCSELDKLKYEKKELRHMQEVLPSMIRRIEAKARSKDNE